MSPRRWSRPARARATPITWIGKDPAGETLLASLGEAGVSPEGVAVNNEGRTPVSVLAYQPDGGCICLYDPGPDDRPTLTATQWRLVAEAEWVCVTVGPASVADEILAMIRDRTRLVWVVKADRKAFAPRLAARLAARADVISASRGEAAFLVEAIAAAPPRRSQIRVETRGSTAPRSPGGETSSMSRPCPWPCPTRPAPATLLSAASSPP